MYHYNDTYIHYICDASYPQHRLNEKAIKTVKKNYRTRKLTTKCPSLRA
jgi:hypothetical protein